MAQPNPLFTMRSQPGVRRDGTDLDSPFYADVVWTRFQRGKPRKIGGYAQLSGQLSAPIRSVFVNGRNGITTAHYFGQWGVQRQVLSGVSATGLVDRTPVGFTPGDRTWSHATMYSATGGAYMALMAASTPDLADITSGDEGSIYVGDVNGEEPLTVVEDGSGPLLTSGGICVLQPFLVVYGNNGLLRNSNANDFSAATGWTTGGSNLANSANPAGSKFVYGAPVRGGGQSPAGLFWSLDSLVRMSYVGGSLLWSYDTLTHPTSILGKKTVVERDGMFFWIGTNRFLFYNGVVQELPNQMNCNDFFDNLNYEQRNKVWGTKVERFGEIWWFYPRGSDTECNNAIIFNYLENTWYEAVCQRSAGHSVQIYPRPVWAGGEDAQHTVALPVGVRLALSATTLTGSPTLTFAAAPTGVAVGQVASGHPGVPGGAGAVVSAVGALTVTLTGNATADIPAGTALTFTSMTTGFVAGQLVTGGTSGSTGIAVRVTELQINVSDATGAFTTTEALTGGGGATAELIADQFEQTLESVYRHETGWDKVVGQDVSALRAGFTTCNFGFAVGDPFGDIPQTLDLQTRVTRIEPDLDQIGALELTVRGKSYAAQEYRDLEVIPVPAGQNFLSPRAQERILQIKVESNVQGGFFQLGATLITLAPGDERGNG